jgi:hypothetical protein
MHRHSVHEIGAGYAAAHESSSGYRLAETRQIVGGGGSGPMEGQSVGAVSRIGGGAYGGGGDMGRLLTALRERSQQQAYAGTLTDVLTSGAASDSAQLPEALQKTQDRIAKLDQTIQELTARIHASGVQALGQQETGRQASDRQTRDILQTAQKYYGAVAGAYGIYQAGAQQGVTVGGVLSGANQGAEIGAMFGPGGAAIGAIAGGALDLFGGLFGHRRRPDTTNRDTNPALTYAPEGFAYDAYRFRATGQLPTSQQLGLNLQSQNQPPIQVIVSLDGVKQTIKAVLNGSTTTAQASLSNNFVNLARPI